MTFKIIITYYGKVLSTRNLFTEFSMKNIIDLDLIKELNDLTFKFNNFTDPKLSKIAKKQAIAKILLLEDQILHCKYSMKMIDPYTYVRKLTKDEDIFGNIFIKKNHSNKKYIGNSIHQNQLLLPFLLYLFCHSREKLPALAVSTYFMKNIKNLLMMGDFEKLKTGQIRFINNIRLCSIKLHQKSLIRTENKYYYNSWVISNAGAIISLIIIIIWSEENKYLKLRKNIIEDVPFDEQYWNLFCGNGIVEIADQFIQEHVKNQDVKNKLRESLKMMASDPRLINKKLYKSKSSTNSLEKFNIDSDELYEYFIKPILSIEINKKIIDDFIEAKITFNQKLQIEV